ncbi:MAG: DUF4810 domain-containing protein [Bacteroidales bacterium]|nr:DUF4810 domain-containing protein [Bacteroidales bacterium]
MKTFKSLVIILSLILMFSSCSTTSMYYWGPVSFSDNTTGYEKSTYNYYKYQSPESICNMIETYRDIMIKCEANERMIPPGICADFGYILLNPENATYFDEYATKSQKRLMDGIVFSEYGKELLEKEIELYPESRQFIEPILKRMSCENKED